MTIKILPARLANQIAAGEVVERPASVVKELVENSIDSGATRIDVDIEKGGSKLIRVRDNGKGIVKDELALALSRHATSKIHTLDDLEAIVSLGFRGEALASISSVSRLTLTSKPADQEEAWTAYSEGRDMQVKLMPAAHPVGTTLEVSDLFFNTPARRKFLRTEKTEFAHIDELLKRIALSCNHVSLTLKHNGKIIRQYRGAQTQQQIEKRVTVACGPSFMHHAVSVDVEHNNLKLFGWITKPEGARNQSDLQYCYVNGRMMRDKLINHAIRQSYENTLRAEQSPTYILFIEIDPHQVDVNVHPAKHEVRFHQSRLVHDFIYQGLSDGLSQVMDIETPSISQAAYGQANQIVLGEDDVRADNDTILGSDQNCRHDLTSHTQRQPVYTDHAYQEHAQAKDNYRSNLTTSRSGSSQGSSSQSGYSQSSYSKSSSQQPSSTRPQNIEKQSAAYRALFGTVESEMSVSEADDRLINEPDSAVNQSSSDVGTINNEQREATKVSTKPIEQLSTKITDLGKALTIIDHHYLLTQTNNDCLLIDLNFACSLRLRGQFKGALTGTLKSQPLLIPLSLSLSLDAMTNAALWHQPLRRLGFEFNAKGKNGLVVMGVPQPLRQQNLQQLIPQLLQSITDYTVVDALSHDDGSETNQVEYLMQIIIQQIMPAKNGYTLSEAIQLISDLEHAWGAELWSNSADLIQVIDFSALTSSLSK